MSGLDRLIFVLNYRLFSSAAAAITITRLDHDHSMAWGIPRVLALAITATVWLAEDIVEASAPKGKARIHWVELARPDAGFKPDA